jgi:hypothetical protein
VVPGSLEKYHEKILISHMISNDESLEWVCDQLIQGKRIGSKNNILANIRIEKPVSNKERLSLAAKKGTQVPQRAMN